MGGCSVEGDWEFTSLELSCSGMTEAGPVLSMSAAFVKQPLATKLGSCGNVVRNAEMKVIDPDTHSPLGYNQPGEICIRGPQIMKGYLNDLKSTAATIDEQGWFHTGDIRYVDHDGEVFIVDRVKELIKFKGFQVPPAELEALLVSHVCIADAAVVPPKDGAAGEVPVAFVVLLGGMELTEEAVKDYIAKQKEAETSNPTSINGNQEEKKDQVPLLVITEKGLSDLTCHHLSKAGLSEIDNNRIVKAYGAVIVHIPYKLQESDMERNLQVT